MEPTEDSEAQDFSRNIDIVAFEYGWTVDQIFDLTADQLALFLEAGIQRRQEELVIQIGMVRLAVASVMSKEGHEAYENFMSDIRGRSRIVQVKELSLKDLANVGLGVKK